MKRILEVKKKIGNLSKNSKNPFFKSQYLDLNDLLNEVEPLLHEQGLLLLQPIIDGKVWSIIVSVEDDKEVCQSSIELPPITDPQKLGSCITYFRRYTLKSLLAIAEKDDDGNKVIKPPTKTPTELMNECKTLAELQNVFLSLDKREQVRQENLKNELKLKLK